MSKLVFLFSENNLNFSLVLTQSFCAAFKDLEYSTQGVWTTIIMVLMVLFVGMHFNCMELLGESHIDSE